MKVCSLTLRDFRRLRRLIARPPKPTQALIDLMRNTPRQPTVEETLRAEISALKAKLAQGSAPVMDREATLSFARRAAPAVDETELDRLREAATLLTFARVIPERTCTAPA